MILLNGNPLDVTRFPDNTTQVWKLPHTVIHLTNFAHITWEFSQEGEFLHIAQLKSLLDSLGIDAALRIKYLPYGRQDKKVSNDATFALRTFAKLLNTLEFQEVIILDPHSTIAIDLINNSRAIYPVDDVMKIAFDLKTDLFCYPDNGAAVKYTSNGNPQKEIYDYPCISGEKVRDQSTGYITSYQLMGDAKGKKVLIVDDICDGGATFKILAKALLETGATEVNLFVTHGIFSNGLRTIKESGIKRIFTAKGEVSEHQNQLNYRRL